MAWTTADIPDLSGRTAVVTGANRLRARFAIESLPMPRPRAAICQRGDGITGAGSCVMGRGFGRRGL